MKDVTLEEAMALLDKQAKTITGIETIKLEEAAGRLLAKTITAPIANPPFDRSPLDGYAFKAESSIGASSEKPVCLKVIGEVCAGDYFDQEVKIGETVRIMTGAPIPRGCDCVLRQEDTDEGQEVVSLYKSLTPYSNYCFKGEDIKEGSILLKQGEKLSAITIGILASMGIREVEVKSKLKLALLCTGDELMPLGKPLAPGKIYNSNEIMLRMRCKELGVEVIVLETCEDTTSQIAIQIKEAIEKVDLVITTGGVSVGKKDKLHEVIKELGAKRLFWRIQMQPGTPVLAASLNQKLIIGLSGNPFAALANFELIVRPVLAKLTGDATLTPIRTQAILRGAFSKMSKKRRFIRANYVFGEVFLNHNNHASGALYTMSVCNCLIDIPKGTSSLSEGEKVDIVLI